MRREPAAETARRGARASRGTSFEAEALPCLDAVYRFALRLTGSETEAEDLTQETFLKAHRSWGQYTSGTRVKSWLFTICRNTFLRDRARSRRHREIVAERSRGADSGDAVQPVWATGEMPPDAAFFTSLVDDSVLEEIARLDEDFRVPLLLSDVEGLTYAEIAEVTEVPVGTVKSRLFRARRRLQEALYAYAVESGFLRPGARASDGPKEAT